MTATTRQDWHATATNAAQAELANRLRSVTEAWAAARQTYLILWTTAPEDVPALRKASRRYQNLDQTRRLLTHEARQRTADTQNALGI